jgi:DNA-3-methyladenine glycosylase II
VLPDLDLGIKRAIELAYGLGRLATPAEVLAIGAPWAPWRTVASWYLWRSLENGDGQGTG